MNSSTVPGANDPVLILPLPSPVSVIGRTERVFTYWATAFGSDETAATSGPWPVSQADGSFCWIVSHGCTVMSTLMSGCDFSKSLTMVA